MGYLWLRSTHFQQIFQLAGFIPGRGIMSKVMIEPMKTLMFINFFIHSSWFIHPFIHSLIHSFIVRLSIHSFTHPPCHSFIHPLFHSFIHSSILLFIHSLIHSVIHPCIHSFIHSSSNSFIHSFPHSLTADTRRIRRGTVTGTEVVREPRRKEGGVKRTTEKTRTARWSFHCFFLSTFAHRKKV